MSSGYQGGGTRLDIMDKAFLPHVIFLIQLITPMNECSHVIQKAHTGGQKNISYLCCVCSVVLGWSRDYAYTFFISLWFFDLWVSWIVPGTRPGANGNGKAFCEVYSLSGSAGWAWEVVLQCAMTLSKAKQRGQSISKCAGGQEARGLVS